MVRSGMEHRYRWWRATVTRTPDNSNRPQRSRQRPDAASSRCSARFRGVAHLAGDVDQPAHRLDRFVEGGLLVAIELQFDNALDAAAADHHRHADIEVLDGILASEPRGAGQDALLVAQI